MEHGPDGRATVAQRFAHSVSLGEQSALLGGFAAIADALTGGGDLPTVLRTVADEALRLLRATSTRVRIPDEGETELLLAAVADDDRAAAPLPSPDATMAIATDPVAGRAYRERRIVLAQGIPEVPTGLSCVVPLTIRDRRHGVLVVWRALDAPFSDADIAMARIFGDAAALAIEQVRLLTTERTRARRMETLTKVARVIGAATGHEAVYAAVYAACTELFGADRFSIARTAPDGAIIPVLWYDNGQRRPEREGMPLESGLRACIVRENTPIRTPDVAAEYARRGLPHPAWVPPARRDGAPQPWLGVPIRDGERAAGVIVASGRAAPFTDEESRVLLAIADQAGVAIRNIDLIEQQRQRAARMQTLVDASREISAATDPPALYEAVRAQCDRLLGARSFHIARVRETTGELITDIWYDRDERHHAREGVPLVAGLGPIVAATHQPLVTDHYAGECARRGIPLGDLPTGMDTSGAWMGMPLLAGQRLLGVVAVGSAGGRYTNEEREVFQAIAHQASVALTNVRLLEENGRRAERLATLADISRAISAVTDPDALYDVVYRECSRLLPMETARICRIEPGTGEIVAESFFVNGARVREMEGTVLIGGLSPAVRDTGRPVLTNDYPGELVRRDLAPPDGPLPPLGSSWLGVPIMQGEQIYGVISLNTTARPLTAEDRDTLLAIANQVGIAMANARLIARERERAARMTTLTEVAQSISAATDRETLYDAVYRQCARLFSVEHLRIARVHPETNAIVPEFWYVDGVRRFDREGIPLTYGLSFVVAETRQPFGTADYVAACTARGIPTFDPDHSDARPGAKAWLGVPLLAGDTLLGVIAIYGKGSAYTDEEQEAFTAIANQVSVAIQNIDLIEREQLRGERLAVLGEVARAISAVLDTDALLGVILRETPRLFPSQSLMVGYWDEGRRWFHEESRNEGAKRLPFAEVMAQRALTRQVVETGATLVVQDYESEMRARGLPPRRFPYVRLPSGWVGVPLQAKGRVIGIIAASADREHLFESNIRLLEMIARQAGVAIENARLVERERERAERLAILNDISRTISAELELGPLLASIAQECTRLVALRMPIIAHRTTLGDWVTAIGVPAVVEHHAGEKGLGPLSSLVMRTGQPLAARDYEAACAERGATPRPPEGVDLPTGWLGVPMVVGERTIGIIAGFVAPEQATAENAQLLSIMANQATIAIANTHLYRDAQFLGVVEERNRLAREIHDTIAQSLTATTYQLELADTFLDASPPRVERAVEKVNRALDLTRGSLDEARRSVTDLRASHVQNVTLADALRRLAGEFTADNGVAVTVDAAADFPHVPSPVRAGLYRIAQEALANIAKYARATGVELTLGVEEGAITMTVRDNGVGFDPAVVAAQRTARGASGGFGLIGIRERAQLLGGTSDIRSDLGAGTEITVRVPVRNTR
jgi:GAF domain-containing protein